MSSISIVTDTRDGIFGSRDWGTSMRSSAFLSPTFRASWLLENVILVGRNAWFKMCSLGDTHLLPMCDLNCEHIQEDSRETLQRNASKASYRKFHFFASRFQSAVQFLISPLDLVIQRSLNSYQWVFKPHLQQSHLENVLSKANKINVKGNCTNHSRINPISIHQ